MSDTRYTIPLFALGIILRYYFIDFCIPFLFYLACPLLIGLILYFFRHHRCHYSLIGCLALSFGLSYADWRIGLQDTSLLPLTPGKHMLTGHIVSLPEDKETVIRFQFMPDQHSQRMLVSVQKAKNTHNFLPGQRWALSLHIPSPQIYHNPGGEQRKYGSTTQSLPTHAFLHAATLLAQAKDIAIIEQIRALLQHKITAVLGNTPHANMISALTIGDQSRLTETQWQRFREAGIIHLVSISGLHVTMLAGLVMLSCRRLFYQFPKLIQKWPAHHLALIAGLIVALSYAVLAGFSVPTQRTIFMLLASVCALLSSKNLTPIQIWLSALLAVLLLEPAAVLSIGFWLSFLCVGALILSSMHTLRPQKGLGLWIKSQWIAGLASLPILAILFHTYPVLSPLANAIAIPLVSVIVTPMALLGLLDPSGYLLHFAQYALMYQDYLLDYLLYLPHTYHFSAPPTWTFFPAAFATLLLLFPVGLPLRYWAWIGFLPLFLLSRNTLQLGQWRAVTLDVGQGLSVFIQTQHHQLVFDTGKKAAARPALLPLLQYYGVHTLDTLILSHDDNDHTGGAEYLMQHIPVKQLLSSLPPSHPLQSKVQMTNSCLIPISWEWDGVSFTLLPLSMQQHTTDDNSRSCILKVHTPTLSMLIPGDIGFKEEAALIATYPHALDVDIVVAPHHGSKYASSDAFIQATSAQWVIFSAGQRNRYHHPHPNTLARYQAQGSHILRTDEMGAILIQAAQENTVAGFKEN